MHTYSIIVIILIIYLTQHQYTKKCPYRDGRLAIAMTIGMAIANMYAYSHAYRCILRSIGMIDTYSHTYRDAFRPIV
jgi:uncharacterized protein (UPF0333 family)